MTLPTALLIETTVVTTESPQGTSLGDFLVSIVSGIAGGLLVLYIQTKQRNKKEDEER